MELTLGPQYVVEVEDRLSTALSRRNGTGYASPPQSLEDARRLAGRRDAHAFACPAHVVSDCLSEDLDPLVRCEIGTILEDRDLDVTLENGKSWPSVRDKLLAAAALLVLSASAHSATADTQRYPTRPVRIVVGFAAGGPTGSRRRVKSSAPTC